MYIISHAEFLKVADITLISLLKLRGYVEINRLVTTTRKYLMET